MSVEMQCVVESLDPSQLPNIYILRMNCGDTRITMDIHRMVNIVEVNDKVLLRISKQLPEYEEGKDFVAHGYVMEKVSNEVCKLYISLWGFLVVVETKDKSLLEKFDHLDKVYLHIKKIS